MMWFSKHQTFALLALAVSAAYAAGQDSSDAKNFFHDPDDMPDCCTERSSLNLHKLCAHYITGRCITGEKVHADHVCADHVTTKNLHIDAITADMVCSATVSATNLCAVNSAANNAYLENITSNTLCALIGRIKQLETEQARLNNICTQLLSAQQAVVGSATFNTSCAQTAQAQNFMANNASINTLCTQTGVMDTLCVNNLTAQNFESCNNYRATVVMSHNITYTLDTPIPWDTVLDDPNGNVIMSSTGTMYIVPEDGYYLFTLQVDQDNLVADAPILGVPVASPQLIVNGNIHREGLIPFLTFSSLQETTYTAIVTLHAGDVVITHYDIRYIDAGGLQEAVGTVQLLGNGTEEHQSVFKIIQLSPLCSTTPPCSSTCVPVTVPCNPILVTCVPVETSCTPLSVVCSPCSTSTHLRPSCRPCCDTDSCSM